MQPSISTQDHDENAMKHKEDKCSVNQLFIHLSKVVYERSGNLLVNTERSTEQLMTVA